MEKATIIRLTLDEARELYKSNNETLMGLALQAFPEDVLNPTPFNKIKSFEDAITVLGMNIDDENYTVNTLKERSKAMAAMYKLNIIRKALNLGQDLHLTKDPEDSYIYYPYNPFVIKSSIYYESKINSGEIEIIGKFKYEGEEYNVLNGRANDGGYAGLGHFYSSDGVGGADAPIGYLGCANEDIAKHFGKYFGMLITESKYGDMIDFNIIEDKYGCTQ